MPTTLLLTWFQFHKGTIRTYDEQHKFEYASGGIKGDTGKKADDDRQVELSGTLQPTAYGRYEIATPEAGWDSLLASKTA